MPQEDWLDEQFPLGDGVADTTAAVLCPYCGEELELTVDPGGAAVQRYIEDCEVCCRPMQLTVQWDAEGRVQVEAVTEEEP